MSKPRSRRDLLFSLLGLLLAGAARADARTVTFPITLDDRFLTNELRNAAYTDPGETAVAFDDGAGCNSLVLTDPRVRSESGRLRVRTWGEGRVGVALAGRCLLPLSWSGDIELLEEPQLDPEAPVVRFVVVDSKLFDAQGQEPLATGLLWRWIKEHVHPRLETRVDLQVPVDELRSLLPTFGVAPRGGTVDQALASLSLSAVDVRDGAVAVQVELQVPEPPPTPTPTPEPTQAPESTPSPPAPAAPEPGAASSAGGEPPQLSVEPSPAPEPPLDQDELRRWQTALQQWDAFLTFVVKVTGRDAKAVELRQALLEILLDERYALLDALANPDPSRPDPVRPLFVRTWTRLAPVLRQVSDTLPADEALRYVAFVSAGDALQALDQLGPEYGIEISADGLRRFARLVAPTSVEDPLLYGNEVDPQLRELFGFGPPIAPPADNPEVEPSSWLSFGSTAWAADGPHPELLKRLNSWAPTRDDVHEYAPLAWTLLQSVTEGLLERHAVPAEQHGVFRALLPATAWKESCWRQFVERGGKLAPLTSPVGSIGIMQVNVSVWRGFYDVQGLRRDIGYNARAGGEILARYFLDYALARGEHLNGGPDALARAAYAAYNGGPSQLTRYRAKKRPKRERRVDSEFLDVYRRCRAGDVLGVVECFTE